MRNLCFVLAFSATVFANDISPGRVGPAAQVRPHASCGAAMKRKPRDLTPAEREQFGLPGVNADQPPQEQLDADGRSRHTIRQYGRHVRPLPAWAAQVGHSGRVFTENVTARRDIVSSFRV